MQLMNEKLVINEKKIAPIIADEIKANIHQVEMAISLLDEGATVPFIARYRKEVTQGLDDSQLRHLETRLAYLRELNERKKAIIESIRSQDKLTHTIEIAITEAMTKTEVEDLYLPFKSKRQTKASLAKVAGLEPLSLQLLLKHQAINLHTPEAKTILNGLSSDELIHKSNDELALNYLNPEQGVTDVTAVLEGVKAILTDEIAHNAEILKKIRLFLWENAYISSKVEEEKKQEAVKYSDYFDFNEAIKKIPSHRGLALLRGQKEGFLKLQMELPEELKDKPLSIMLNHLSIKSQSQWMESIVNNAWKTKIFPSLSNEMMATLKDASEKEAITVFAKNLKSLLLAPPVGNKSILGIDPGFRTGCKIACIDQTGKLLDHTVIYPHAPQNQWQKSIEVLKKLCQKHEIEFISVGNGTASRESDILATELCQLLPSVKKVIVSEAGASVYSASELASHEFPNLDVSIRGAISIARRLQDPLAELVKIDPKSIGVGQYQHDVNQTQLTQSLTNVVEDCVNAVGVDVNTASVSLLTNISGLNQTIAKNIVHFRDQSGAFINRNQLKKVPRLGEKTFEQAAGFLKIKGANPLDNSRVHPEAYPVVERILKKQGKELTNLNQLIGNKSFLVKLNPSDYVCERFGLPTVIDIIKELEKPGIDPRSEFKTALFNEEIQTIDDLKAGMILEGTVTNVANFGAFVDLGVHQDGLVHISELSDTFIKDPHEVIKVGEVVKVKVLEIDAQRKRIQLSMKLNNSLKNVINKEKNKPVPKLSKPEKQVNNPFLEGLKNFKK